MDDADRVRRGDGVTQLLEDLADHRVRHRTVLLDVIAEGLPLEQLHRDPRHLELLVDAGGDDLRDVLARDPRGHLRFALEALEERFVGDVLAAQDLQGAMACGAELLGDVERAHRAPSERAHDHVVVADDRAEGNLGQPSFVGRDISGHRSFEDSGYARTLLGVV